MTETDDSEADHDVADGKRQYGDAVDPHAHDGRMLSSRGNPHRAYPPHRARGRFPEAGAV